MKNALVPFTKHLLFGELFFTIGAYGIINRLLTLYIMIVLGLTMGMQPIVGYNFGAQKHDRVKQTLKLSILTGVCITSSGFLICELFPHAVSAIFTNDQELIDIASRGVRICVLMFPLVGAQIVIGNFFQRGIGMCPGSSRRGGRPSGAHSCSSSLGLPHDLPKLHR